MTYYVNEDGELVLVSEEEVSLESGNAYLEQWLKDQDYAEYLALDPNPNSHINQNQI